MTPASARGRSTPAAADELDQLVEREDRVGALDEGHLQPEPLDRNADLGGRVGHLAGALGDRVVAEHECAAAAAREPGKREQAGVVEEALQVGPHAGTGERRRPAMGAGPLIPRTRAPGGTSASRPRRRRAASPALPPRPRARPGAPDAPPRTRAR